VAQLAINPAALDHVFDRQAALLVEGDISDAARLGCREIILAGIAAIGRDLPRRHAAMGDLPLEHRQEAFGIGGVTGLDDEVEDQATAAGDQVELVSVLHVASALDDDVGMRLEQADQLLAGLHRLAIEDATLALGEDALDQREIVAELGAPALGRDAGEVGQPLTGLLQRRPGGASGGHQLTIESAPVGFAAAVFDRSRASWPAAGDRATAVPALPATPQLAAIAVS